MAGKSKKKKTGKVIVTSALPYVNNVPHLGTLVCVISADVYAKFLKLKGADVISVCGTDEHGTTAEVKALEEGVTPKQLVDKYFKIHKEAYEWFGCSFDCFGRTSSEANKEVAIDIFNKLDKNGYIAEQTVEQAYCSKCGKFLADRYVEGTCPYCGYEEARGDQCESCGKLLNATELIKPKCKVCGEEPEVRESNHLFIDLPKIEPKLRKWMDKVKKNWSVNARTMSEAWLKEGLRPRCISRDLKWGISIPKKGYEKKVFYSWFDAPIGYIGITKECKKNWKSYWLNPKTRLVQFMGKDNIPFHTILFPSFLIGTGDPYSLVSDLSVNEYLNYEGGMFSKSRGVGVFSDDAMETGIASDIWRYYIMSVRPESSDSEFVWEDMQARVNNELVANLGNLVNRTVTFLNRFFDSEIPAVKEDSDDKKFLKKIKEEEKKFIELMEDIKLMQGVKQILKISGIANKYFQDSEPWKLAKEDKEKAGTKLAILANVVKDLSIIISPYLSETSIKIRQLLNIEESGLGELGKISLKKGHEIGEAEILFSKIEDEQIKKFRERFGGAEGKFALNLRVAEITKADAHPDADKLVVLQTKIGKKKRQIVAGIREYYTLDELPGKKIVVVTNLKPAKLRGVESQGMLLAAVKGKKLALLEAPGSKSGERVKPGNMKVSEEQITVGDFAKIEMNIKDKKVIYDTKTLKAKKEEISANIEDGAKVE